jgi:hypothetical protein
MYAVSCMPQSAGQLSGAPAQSQLPDKQEEPVDEQLHKLPPLLQLQSHLLQCMHLIVQHLQAGIQLPRSLGHALLEHLLLPRHLLQQELAQSQDSEQALDLWMQWQQHLSMQVSRRQLCSSMVVGVYIDMPLNDDDTKMALRGTEGMYNVLCWSG